MHAERVNASALRMEDYLLFASDGFCAGLNLVLIKCLGTPFPAGVFSRNALAEASCFR
jgi:hypothetical protein